MFSSLSRSIPNANIPAVERIKNEKDYFAKYISVVKQVYNPYTNPRAYLNFIKNEIIERIIYRDVAYTVDDRIGVSLSGTDFGENDSVPIWLHGAIKSLILRNVEYFDIHSCFESLAGDLFAAAEKDQLFNIGYNYIKTCHQKYFPLLQDEFKAHGWNLIDGPTLPDKFDAYFTWFVVCKKL